MMGSMVVEMLFFNFYYMCGVLHVSPEPESDSFIKGC